MTALTEAHKFPAFSAPAHAYDGRVYAGNLTCRSCGLTFTGRWGSTASAYEFRCGHDHVVHVDRSSGAVVAIDGAAVDGPALADVFGRCPRCATELATGRLPRCPVCGGDDHDVVGAGTID